MSAGGYEAFFQSSQFGPNWMHGKWGNAYWRSIGKVLDAQNDLLRNAVSARTPDGAVALGMSDALDRAGDDRLLPRGSSTPDADPPDESDASYAARLKSAWTTWGQDDTLGGGGGSVLGILTQLEIAGFPVQPTPPNYWTTGAFLINHIGRIYQLNTTGGLHVVGEVDVCANRQNLDGSVSGTLPGFTLDARDQFYSRWCLLFPVDVPSLVNTPCIAKAKLNQICDRWKSASAIYSGAAIVPSGNFLWGWPTGSLWGTWRATWGTGTSARFIDPT
jgi:hypothetical protein